MQNVICAQIKTVYNMQAIEIVYNLMLTIGHSELVLNENSVTGGLTRTAFDSTIKCMSRDPSS